MPLKLTLDSLDELDQAFHELYTEKDGKYVLTGVEGLKTQADVDRITAALNNERTAHKKTKERFSVLGDRDINEVVEMLDRYPELEAAAQGALDDNKVNELVEAKLKTKLAPVEREKATLTQRLQELTETVTAYETKERQRAIHDAVRQAATSAKVLPEALEDALMLAERVFEVDEEGKVITRDGVGVTPGVDPVVWLTDIQTKRPHWWGPTVGAGARGSNGAGGGGTNPWTRANWNVTEQGRIMQENRQRAEQMAKAAGTQIGGLKPEK